MRILRSALRSRVALTSLCVVVWVGLLVVGWWPFNFIPRNQVTWLRGGHGIHFERYGQVFSLPPASPENYRGPLTIEIWLRSAQRSFDYSEIACFGGKRGRGLVIAQSGPDMVVEGGFLEHDGSFKDRQIFLPGAFASGSDRFLTITATYDRTLVYLDSTLHRTLPSLRTDDVFSGLLIGHSPDLNDPWSGDLLGLGVYRRFLTPEDITRHRDFWRAGKPALLASEDAPVVYPVDEDRGAVIHNRAASGPDLMIPEKFYRQGSIFLEHGLSLDRSQLQDIVVNIAGFIPFGFLLALFARSVVRLPSPQAALLAIVFGTLTSLLIELLQVYLPTRDSSLVDVIANSVGSGCGAFILLGLSAFLARSAVMVDTLSVAGETSVSRAK